ncbi:hypothetical protein TI39_contig1085g00001 [Zymoseptoria brevis]|uniref:Uncharacterized protein n=1 Tax=Zymoseptoria brevis TaxID=1047168 RepID=A0A0F4GHQ2_9PEZI|nr:hypothetical protein TI39_contig1085g00001 [Zymoseptoria brevis]
MEHNDQTEPIQEADHVERVVEHEDNVVMRDATPEPAAQEDALDEQVAGDEESVVMRDVTSEQESDSDDDSRPRAPPLSFATIAWPESLANAIQPRVSYEPFDASSILQSATVDGRELKFGPIHTRNALIALVKETYEFASRTVKKMKGTYIDIPMWDNLDLHLVVERQDHDYNVAADASVIIAQTEEMVRVGKEAVSKQYLIQSYYARTIRMDRDRHRAETNTMLHHKELERQLYLAADGQKESPKRTTLERRIRFWNILEALREAGCFLLIMCCDKSLANAVMDGNLNTEDLISWDAMLRKVYLRECERLRQEAAGNLRAWSAIPEPIRPLVEQRESATIEDIWNGLCGRWLSGSSAEQFNRRGAGGLRTLQTPLLD